MHTKKGPQTFSYDCSAHVLMGYLLIYVGTMNAKWHKCKFWTNIKFQVSNIFLKALLIEWDSAKNTFYSYDKCIAL